MSLKLVFSIISMGLVATAHGSVLFQSDFEEYGSLNYLTSGSPHQGGGYISWLGGTLSNGYVPGDGTQDITVYNNVVLDDSQNAQNPYTGARYSLKTQYRAGHAHSFQKNTTIFAFPETDTVYIRWYQKWSNNWIWPTDQQKLLKIKGKDISQNFKVTGGNNFINLTHISPSNPDLNETYVFSDWDRTTTDWRQEDNYNNKLGQDGSDINYPLKTGQWYCIETYVKANTPGLRDAEYRYWINDELVFELTNTDARSDRTGGMTVAEMQHVYQNLGGTPTTIDMPTWMSNIVISTSRVGCQEGEMASPPTAPALKIN